MAPFGDAARLEALVQACLQGAEARGAIQAAAFLRANAARVEQRLRALSAWADGKSPGGADERGPVGVRAGRRHGPAERRRPPARARRGVRVHMTCAGGPAFWCSGGDIVQTGGRALSTERARALLAWCDGQARAAPDQGARSYFERRQAELARALDHARRWRRAAAPLP